MKKDLEIHRPMSFLGVKVGILHSIADSITYNHLWHNGYMILLIKHRKLGDMEIGELCPIDSMPPRSLSQILL